MMATKKTLLSEHWEIHASDARGQFYWLGWDDDEVAWMRAIPHARLRCEHVVKYPDKEGAADVIQGAEDDAPHMRNFRVVRVRRWKNGGA